MRAFTIAVIILLAGCASTTSMQDTMRQLNQSYDGHKVSDFFLNYGEPVNNMPAENGTLYRWISLEPQSSIPTPVYHSYHTPHGNFAVPDSTTTLSPQPQYCEMRIKADERGIIQNISVIYDSPGKQSNSLCTEIFRQR